ncbi:hypothetical protein UY3_00477 [Chelonia mydas]|uniref:Uncharacterized protein n=1 Tax=Chelonia mydas TaxID=8469 RepID=M7C2E6_CHEMY|nr:hypothetical protein UY3_00477 [Chelonia mydas]
MRWTDTGGSKASSTGHKLCYLVRVTDSTKEAIDWINPISEIQACARIDASDITGDNRLQNWAKVKGWNVVFHPIATGHPVIIAYAPADASGPVSGHMIEQRNLTPAEKVIKRACAQLSPPCCTCSECQAQKRKKRRELGSV